MTSNQEVSQADVARFVARMQSDPERQLERVLIRTVSEHLFAVQVYYEGERDAEGFFLNVKEQVDDARGIATDA